MVWRLPLPRPGVGVGGGRELGPVQLPRAGLHHWSCPASYSSSLAPGWGVGSKGPLISPGGPRACSPSLLAPIPAATQRHLLTSES